MSALGRRTRFHAATTTLTLPPLYGVLACHHEALTGILMRKNSPDSVKDDYAASLSPCPVVPVSRSLTLISNTIISWCQREVTTCWGQGNI